MGKLSVIVGGQYGSEAKGAVCAHLTRRSLSNGVRPMVIRVAGPNAGHTAYDEQGRAWALRQVPVGMVVDQSVVGVIADGSEVDLPVLLQEVIDLDAAGLGVSSRLFISGRVSFLTDEHHRAESPEGLDLHVRLGSTGKGIGACRADRALRKAVTPDLLLEDGRDLIGFAVDAWEHSMTVEQAEHIGDLQFLAGSTVQMIREHIANGGHAMIEGTQGYGLGLHRPEYPRVTSSDTRAIDFLAMAGISPWDSFITEFEVWVVVRAFPIRVAGNSGPLYNETSWEELGLPVELTTVTKKPRRVGHWDPELFRAAVVANGFNCVKVAYSMADQDCPDLAGVNGEADVDVKMSDLTPAARDYVQKINLRTAGLARYIGTGPNTVLWMEG